MGSVTRYAALFTKTKSLESRLLSKEDYMQLLELQNETEVIDFLMNKTVYGKGLYKYDEQGEKSILIERALRQYLFDRYEQMMHFVIDEDKRLFKTLLMRYEVESLKMVIRSVYSSSNDERLAEQIVSSKHFQVHDFKSLMTCKTIDAVVSQLMHTKYGLVLKPYLNEPHDRILFFLEMNLDRLYFKQLLDRIGVLKGEGHTFMTTALGANIDFLNIQWIYRGTKHYQLSPEERFNYCLKGGLYLSLKKLKELCYLNSTDALLKALKETKYGYIFSGEHNIDLVIEREMERELYRLFIKQIKKAHFNLVALVGYLHKLEFEIRDLFAILEAKRYSMNADQTKAFLVRTVD